MKKAKEEARLAAIEAAKQERASAAELAAANDPYAVADPASLNFQWAGSGNKALLPERTYDDGEAVFLTWSDGIAIPAILVMNENGEEGPVNFTVRGETVVLDRVPMQIVLRSGEDVATLTNTGPVTAAAGVANAGRRARASGRSKRGS